MSSFFGHSVVASSIYWFAQPSQGNSRNSSRKRFFWLLWLIVVASAPDIDHLVTAWGSGANQGLRITHSILFSLILPCCTILAIGFSGGSISISYICRLTPKGAATQTKPKGLASAKVKCSLSGVRGRQLRSQSLQLIFAGLSHPLLDLLVGVTPLPLLWPIALQRFKLPFGILPSAGRLQLSNYYLYRNLWIEMGVLVPLLAGIFLLRRRAKTPLQQGLQKIASALLLLVSASFMYWGYSLPR